MLRALSLDRTPDFCALIEAFESLMGGEAASSGGHMKLSRSVYGKERLLEIYVENLDNGMACRIIFDPNGIHAGRQGIHTTLECDAYELAEKMDHGCDQGFDTIWVHS